MFSLFPIIVSVPVLLSAGSYWLRFFDTLSRFVFRTVLTLPQIHFYKSFFAIFSFAYVMDAGIDTVFHYLILQKMNTKKTPAVFRRTEVFVIHTRYFIYGILHGNYRKNTPGTTYASAVFFIRLCVICFSMLSSFRCCGWSLQIRLVHVSDSKVYPHLQNLSIIFL